MNAIVLPFPRRPVGSLSAIKCPAAFLAREADQRWPDISGPMVGVAIEMLEQPAGELRAKVRAIFDQGAEGLLSKTDQAMAQAVKDLVDMVGAIELARKKLLAATLAQKDDAHG